MNKEGIKKLLEHEYWANLKVLDMLLELPHIPDKARSLFSHIIAAQDNWFSRVKGDSPQLEIWWDNQNPDEWKPLLEKFHLNWMELLLKETELDGMVVYRNSRGVEFQNSIREIVLHLCMHSQYHRGQIITVTRSLVTAPPATDYIAFLRL